MTIDVNRDNVVDRFEISPRPHFAVNYAGCDLLGANLSGVNLDKADLSGATFTGCTGTPTGAPAGGASLPTCS